MNTYSLHQDLQFVQAPAATQRPQYYPVRVTDLSREAVDYLRRQVRAWRRDGDNAATAAGRAQSWCNGYRWFAGHRHERIVMAPAEFVDGYEFAHGEDMYLECMIVDALQSGNPFDLPGYPW